MAQRSELSRLYAQDSRARPWRGLYRRRSSPSSQTSSTLPIVAHPSPLVRSFVRGWLGHGWSGDALDIGA
eukprot:3383880-Pyramimonas_sp.AAC.1